MKPRFPIFKPATSHAGQPSQASEGLDLRGCRWRKTLSAWWLLSGVSTALVISLLLAFYTVVNQATAQSALQQQVLAAQSRAVWRCKLLPGVSARQDCLLAIKDRPAAPVPP